MLILGAVLLLTVFFLGRIVDLRTGEVFLRVDPAVDRLIPETGPDTEFYREVCKRFGSDHSVIIAVVADEIFSADVLPRIARMTARLQNLAAVRRVLSLATAPNVRGVEGELQVDPFVSESGELSDDPETLRRQALASPIYAGNLVSKDGRATALVVEIRDMPESEFNRAGIDQQLLAIANEERGTAEVFITGSPHIKAETSRTLLSDLRFVVPAAFAVASAVAWASFRCWQGVLVPASTIVFALIWTLGTMAWTGHSLNLVTTILPPLLLSVGFGYTVHVFTAYFEAAGRGSKEPAREGVVEVGLPVVLTALTTVAGFLSLTVSPIVAIEEFGFFATLGVTLTAIASLTYVPAMLQVLPVPRNAASSHGGSSRIDGWLEALGRFNIRGRRTIFVLTGVLCAVALYGVFQINVKNDLIGNFLDGAPVRTDFDVINARLGGANTFHVVVEADERDAFKQPENLKVIEDLQKWIAARPHVGSVTSLVDHIRMINWAFNDNDPAFLAIPDSAKTTDQLLFFGENDEIGDFVDSRYKTTRLLVRANTSDSVDLRLLFGDIKSHLDATLPETMSGRPTGNVVLINKSIDDIARGQTTSLTVAFTSIFAILALLFASAWVGFIALLPNAVPVLVYFGTMGLSGIPLDTVTGLVACIVLGIAVDDTIHYMTRFSDCARARADETQGTIDAMIAVGRPMTYTTIALSLGFLTLTLTNLRSQIYFGTLSAFTMFIAWLVDMTLTPALCSGMRIVNLWDVLTLDLGPDLQHSVPLLAGLRRTQARVVALMTDLRTFPAGHELMRLGESGDEMYVVIDGELLVWLERDGRRHELARLHRGDVVGEIALFQNKRSADVVVTQDARLMSLDQRNLERLRARYPRIAAVVYRNLAEILAGRVARTTERLRG